MEKIKISDVCITLIQKNIKNIHLRVYPSKEVRVSAPLRMKMADIVRFIDGKIAWIEKQQKKFSGRHYQKKVILKYRTGEKHFLFGKGYVLHVIEADGPVKVILDGDNLLLQVKKKSTIKSREKVLDDWYRKALKQKVPEYIAAYEEKMQVKVLEFGVKKMKTRWGTCNPTAQRIWVNLALAKKELRCLEYLVVHEMVHLLEANHSKRFYAHMDRFLPDWKRVRDILNGNV